MCPNGRRTGEAMSPPPPDHAHLPMVANCRVVACPYFVVQGRRPTLDGFIDHIVHFAEVAGIDHVGLGLLDGIEFKQTAYALDRDSEKPRWPASSKGLLAPTHSH
jgi:hypothetical protein